MQYGFVIDHSRCIGCHACTVACKAENDVPVGSFRTWVKYTEQGSFPEVRRSFAVLRCNQCTQAPCVTICPVRALEKRPDGVVDVDPARTEGLPLTCHSIVSIYGVLDRLSWIEDGFPGGSTMLELYAGKEAFGAEVGPELAITPMDFAGSISAPPMLLTVGTEDPLLRSSRLFTERMGAGPGKIVLREYPGEPHGFFNFGTSGSAAQLNADILDFLAAEDPGTA